MTKKKNLSAKQRYILKLRRDRLRREEQAHKRPPGDRSKQTKKPP